MGLFHLLYTNTARENYDISCCPSTIKLLGVDLVYTLG